MTPFSYRNSSIVLSLILAAVAGLAACGKNAHVTGQDPALEMMVQTPVKTDKTGLDAKTPPTRVGDAADPANSSGNGDGPEIIVIDGGQEPSTPPAAPAPVAPPVAAAPVTPPLAPPSVVVLPGEQGPRGPKGEAGKSECGLRPRAVVGEIKALSNDELARIRKNNGIELPYILDARRRKGFWYPGKTTAAPTITLLTIGDSNHKEKVAILADGREVRISRLSAADRKNVIKVNDVSFVVDSEILFDVVFTLPDRKTIDSSQPVSATLNLNMFKYAVDQYLDTEMICVLNEGICSGKEYTNAYWKQFLNPQFGHNHPMYNDYLSREIILGLKSGLTRIADRDAWNATRPLDLATLLGKSGAPLSNEELLEILYKNAVNGKATLHMLVADDTFVGGPEKGTGFTVNFVQNTCLENAGGGQ